MYSQVLGSFTVLCPVRSQSIGRYKSALDKIKYVDNLLVQLIFDQHQDKIIFLPTCFNTN
jgi:hypothetical protein